MSSTDISELCSRIQAIDIHAGGARTCQTILVVPEICVPHELFWSSISKLLEQKPHTIQLHLQGVGNVTCDQIRPLITHNVSIASSKILGYIHKLKHLNISLDNPTLSQSHRAALTNQPDLVTYSDANSLDSTGRTPLHYAVYFEHVRVIQALIANGAIPDFTTPHHTSPLYDNQELVAPLLQNSTIKDTSNGFSKLQRKIIATSEAEVIDVPVENITELATCLFALYPNKEQRTILIHSNPLPNIVTEYMKEEAVRRDAYHYWKVEWNFTTSFNQTIPQRIFYSYQNTQLTFTPIYGGFPAYFSHKMQKATSDFIKLYGPQQWLVTLCSSLNHAAKQASASAKELYERFLNNEPIIIHVKIDSPHHAIAVMIWDYHIFICNKGAGSRKAVEVFRFQKPELDTSILARMKTSFDSLLAFQNYFFVTLFIRLQFKQKPIELEFENLCEEPGQIVGNCARESTETCVRAYFMFSVLKENILLGRRSCNLERVKSICSIQLKLFDNWNFNQQIDCLSKYLKKITAPNRQFASNYELLDTIIAQYKTKRNTTWIIPEIRAKMAALESAYPKYLQEG